MQTPRGVKDSLGQPNLRGSGVGIVSRYGNAPLTLQLPPRAPQGWWDMVLSLPRASWHPGILAALGTAGVTPPEKSSCRKGLEARRSNSPGTDPKGIPGDTGRASCHSHPARIGGSSCPGAIKIPFAGTISSLLCPHTAIKTELLETGRKNHFPLGFELFPDFPPQLTCIFSICHIKNMGISPLSPSPKNFSVSTKVFLEQKK